MKIEWTIEMAKDLSSYYSFNAATEIAKLLKEELDKEKLRTLEPFVSVKLKTELEVKLNEIRLELGLNEA